MDAFEAVERGLTARDTEEARLARRSEVAYRKQIMDANLAQMGKKEASGLNDVVLQNTVTEQKQLRNQLFKQQTYQVLDNYLEDGNVEHLNRWYRESPMLQERDPSIARYDRLSFDNPADTKLLQAEGITPDMLMRSGTDPAELLKRLVKVTNKDGTTKVSDMALVYGATGYTSYRSAEKQKQLASMLSLQKDQAEIETKLANADKTRRMGTEEWVYPPKSAGSQGGTAFERNADAVGRARERMASGEATEADMALLEMHDETVAGNTPGKQTRVDQTETNLFKEFGGEDQFYGTQFTPGSPEYRRAERSVRKIEALSGVNLTSKQVETMGNIRKTIAAGRSAQGLTNADMGLVDNTLKKLGAYVSDDAMGAEARSAWAGIRNQLLHAFAGSAMNEGELERWGEQFGNLYQQGGHVLTTLANALNQLGGELDSLRLALPESSFHVRLGADVNQLNSVIDNIGKAAATLSKKSGSPVAPVSPAYPPNAGRNVPTPTKSNAEQLREMLQQYKSQQGAK